MANGRLWTIEEVDILRKMAAEYKTLEEAARTLKRSKKAVTKYAQKSNIKFKRARDWSKEEEAELIRLYREGVYADVIAQRLNRNTGAIITKACRLGISDRSTKKRIVLTEQDIEDMKEMYEDNEPLRRIAEEYGMTETTVVNIMTEQGLKKRRETGIQATRKDKKIIPFKRLSKMYLNDCLSQDRIAEIEGVSRTAVIGSLNHHGIVKKSVRERQQDRKRFLKKRG